MMVKNTAAAPESALQRLIRAADIHSHTEALGRLERAAIKGQKPCVVWLTGFSASGKSTIANALELQLHEMGHHTMLLDGDNVRLGLNRDLGFSESDRGENIRRIGEVAKLMVDAGLIVIAAFISPYQAERAMVRNLMPCGCFVEVHVCTPLDLCERRDPKGLYKKARSGEIPNFTGISAPYEAPESPEVTLDTSHNTVDDAVQTIIDFLNKLSDTGICDNHIDDPEFQVV